MRFRDLPAEDQADARAALLGGEERNKKIRGIRNSRPFVDHAHFEIAVRRFPADADAAASFERSFDGIMNQIDEQLIELIGIGLDAQIGPGHHGDFHARLEAHNAANPRAHFHRLHHRRRQFGEARIGVHEIAPRLSERVAITARPRCMSSSQSSARLRTIHQGEKIFGHGFDRRERIIQLVSENANQPLPRLPLFFAQGAAHIGNHQQLVRQAALAKHAVPNFPAARLAGKNDGGDLRAFDVEASSKSEFARRCVRPCARRADRASARRRD